MKTTSKKQIAIFLSILMLALVLPSLAFADEATVKAVVIKGNNHVDTSLIQSAISETKVNEPLVEQKILDDLRAIYDLGYFSDANADLEEAVDGVKVVFNVLENPEVKDVVFRGTSLASIDQFKSKMKVRTGGIFNVVDILEDMKLLPDWALMEHGRVLRPIDLQITDAGIVEIELADTVITDIVLEGNTKTKDFVVERELSIKPGDILDMNRINRSLRNVLMLGYFDEINRSFDDAENQDEKVLRIDLSERKTGTATFGVAYSSQEGIVGFVEAADDNFLGRGQRVNATLQLGKNTKSYELGFFEPYIDKGGTSLGVNLYKKDTTVSKSVPVEDELQKVSGKRNVLGGDITLGRPFGEYTRGRIILKAQNISYDPAVDVDPDLWFQDYTTRTVGLGLGTNTTDHPLFPTEGFKNDISMEVGTKLLGGSSEFSKAELEHSRYFEVRDGGYVFAVRGMTGSLLSGELGENEKFRIGGPESIRGLVRGADESLVGDRMLLMNAEFRFPIVEKVHGVLFTDWGRAWEMDEEISLAELNNSYGLGVRLDTPLGLLRLDYGLGKGEDDQRKGQFYFGIGQTF